MFLYNMKTKKRKSKTPYYTLGLLSMLAALYMETSLDVTDPNVNDPDLTALGGRRKSRKRHTHTR